MQFVIKRDILLKSLNFVQGVVEKKNTLPILSNVLIQLKDKKLSVVATDLDIILFFFKYSRLIFSDELILLETNNLFNKSKFIFAILSFLIELKPLFGSLRYNGI